MKELDLYNFVDDNNLEYHYHSHENQEDVILFINCDDLKGFCNILGSRVFDDGGISCILKDGYIALWMRDICENEDIDYKKVFTNKNR